MNDSICKAIVWLYKHIEDLICSWVTAAFCYFFQIKGAIHIMLIIIAADLLFGIIASTWRRNESFSMEKFALAIGRAFVFTAFVSLLFALDKETHQEITASYYIATWIISGGYLWSFLKNADAIFGGWIFKVLQGFVNKQVEDKTGFDIRENQSQNGKL